MADFTDSQLLLGYGGSGKTTALLQRAANAFTDGNFPAKTVILCASYRRAEEFRARLRRHFHDLARQTGENRWISGAAGCAGAAIYHPDNYPGFPTDSVYLLVDDFDRFPEQIRTEIRENLSDFSGRFFLTSTPDCLPGISCSAILLTSAYRADCSLQNRLREILPDRQGMRQDNALYAQEKYLRTIPMENVTQRAGLLITELNRLKRRREFDRSLQRTPRIAVIARTDRQLQWLQTVLAGESLFRVDLPPVLSREGRLISAFLRAVLRPDCPEAMYSLSVLLNCAPDALFLRYIREEMPDLLPNVLTCALNRALNDWDALREEALDSSLPALAGLPGISSGSPLLSLLEGDCREMLHQLEALPCGILSPGPEDILLCRADHPDLPAADYLLLPFVTQACGQDDVLFRRVLSSAGCSLSVLTCGSGEPQSWQDILERGLFHAAHC